MRFFLLSIFFVFSTQSLASDKDSKITCSLSFEINDISIKPVLNGIPSLTDDREKCFKMLKILGDFAIDENPDRELYLSLFALIFGLLVLVGLFSNNKFKFSPEELIKFSGLVIIVSGTLFMISAGWESEQIAPAMGLFGTLAGYLLAKNPNK